MSVSAGSALVPDICRRKFRDDKEAIADIPAKWRGPTRCGAVEVTWAPACAGVTWRLRKRCHRGQLPCALARTVMDESERTSACAQPWVGNVWGAYPRQAR